MSQEENNNLGNKRNEYESKFLNIESILIKIEDVLNISKFRDELDEIKDRYNSYDESVQDYDLATMELDALYKKINDEVLPFYEMHLLTTKIENELKDVINNDIDEIIQGTKKLIDTLVSVSNCDNRDVSYLFDKSYRIIYHVIINEEIFNKSDILIYVNDLNLLFIKENIGKLLLKDITLFNQREDNTDTFSDVVIEEELNNITNEGLGYDYLDIDFIKKISRKLVGKKYIEFESKKKNDISLISSKINSFTRKNNELSNSLNEGNQKIKNLYINKSVLLTKALSLVLVPVITFSLGRTIGKNVSNKITEYKTITRTVDLDTKKIVGDIEYVYDEMLTTYVATVMECGPWRSNPSGVGYIRNITAYECIVPDNVDDGYHITKNDLENNLLEKYSYIESKESLDRNDSTTQTTILLTETYQDKNDTRKSTKYIIPYSILGAGIGLAIDVVLVLTGIYDFYRIRQLFDKLDREIKKCKLSNQEIKDRLLTLVENNKELEEEYSKLVKKYGVFKIEETVINEEKNTSKTVNVKTRIKRRY